ncbi:response regulator [Streptomyces erythrochromogenes]|uniref:response regulator n=1 Tax=Streptomyces erythrochromogenes TaxID=285574 RepID=UPI003644F7D4
MAISVVIADDQEMVRTGFRMILESQPDIEVLADVVDGEAALAAVAEHRPDVLLLDIRMPRLDGLDVTRRLSGSDRPRIVIVTTFDLDEYVHAALHGGASGFLEALVSMRRLVKILRENDDGSTPATATATTPVAGLADIRGLTERFSRTGPPVVLSIENGLEDRLPAHVAATAHRIVLEALTNTAKHAATATAVRVTLRIVPAGLEVRIADDGGRPARLSEKARGGGYGLAGMTERAEALGGHFTAGPAPEAAGSSPRSCPCDPTAVSQADYPRDLRARATYSRQP